MEYFDSKVLESFMIPEDSIVTEGFGSKIIEIGKKVINFLITMITKLISILGNLINRFKHGKTVHNDKETYQENKRLVDATYKDLWTLLMDTAVGAGDLTFLASKTQIVIIKIDENKFYDKEADFERKISILSERYKNVENKLNGKIIYLTKSQHDTIINNMEGYKSMFKHNINELKATLNENQNNEFQKRYASEEIIKECQKRCNILINQSTKYSLLFNNITNLITKSVSPDVITDKDVYKFELS